MESCKGSDLPLCPFSVCKLMLILVEEMLWRNLSFLVADRTVLNVTSTDSWDLLNGLTIEKTSLSLLESVSHCSFPGCIAPVCLWLSLCSVLEASEGVPLGNSNADDPVIAAPSCGTTISTNWNQGEVRGQATCYQSTALLFLDAARAGIRCCAMLEVWAFPSPLPTGWLSLWLASLSAPHLPDLKPWRAALVSYQVIVPNVSAITNLCLTMLLLAINVGLNLWKVIVRYLGEKQEKMSQKHRALANLWKAAI